MYSLCVRNVILGCSFQDSPKEIPISDGKDGLKHSVNRQGEDSVKAKTLLDRLVKMVNFLNFFYTYL